MAAEHDCTTGAGGCFLCDGAAAESQAGQAPQVARRRILQAALAAPLALGPLAGAAPARAHDTGPSADRYAIDTGWTLRYIDDAIQLQRGATIIVAEGRIEEVRERRVRGMHAIDARHLLVVPGFISGHTHVAAGTPTRGLIETGRSLRRPLELVDGLDDASLDALTALNLAELILSGTTTQLEMSLSLRQLRSYIRVARRFGARGYAGAMIPDISRLFPIWMRGDHQVLLDSVPGTLQEIEASLEFARTLADGELLRPMMTPHATDTQTPETLRAIAAAARELDCGIHLHLSQSARESALVQQHWGMSPARWIGEFGFYAAPLFAAHLSGFDFAADAAVLNEAGAVYAHCPSAGGAGGGTQPYPEALGAGMAVNIAIDTHSNDFLENLKLAVLYGQARHALLTQAGQQGLRRPDMAEAIRGATLTAARGLRRDDLGRIDPGARADLVGIDVTGPLTGSGALPPAPLNNLLYAHGASVRLVVTDGRVQVLDGVFLPRDLAELSAAGGKVVAELWRQLDAEGFFE
jgi:cytosine/adenosine deaminase-related metal-dependent hydrolase